MLQIPQHLQSDYDALSESQKQKFNQLAMWGAAGGPGNTIVTDMAFAQILKTIKQMGEEPVEPVEPDRSVNHDWQFDPKANKGK